MIFEAIAILVNGRHAAGATLAQPRIRQSGEQWLYRENLPT
jgi:hypothetical protein